VELKHGNRSQKNIQNLIKTDKLHTGKQFMRTEGKELRKIATR
jgi:hypothetical protein